MAIILLCAWIFLFSFSENLRIERKSICLQMDIDNDGNSLLSTDMTTKIR